MLKLSQVWSTNPVSNAVIPNHCITEHYLILLIWSENIYLFTASNLAVTGLTVKYYKH